MSTVVLDPQAQPDQATPAASVKAAYADWPQPGDQREQPWDHQKAGVTREQQDALLDEPGSPNTASPIVIGHSMPILSSGSGGDQSWAVAELARRLKILGITTSVGTAQNPFAVLDQSVMSAVERFREEHNVHEDPTAFGGNTSAGRQRASAHIGPWTWEAVIRASERKLANA